MTPPQDSTMLDRLRQAREARVEHEQAFVETVRAAMADRQRHSVNEIAQAAGISRVRAYQIAQGSR